MKKMMFTLIAMLTIAASANAMSYEQARNEALFLTDKMAYELNLSDAQYEAAYEINLDYLMGVTSQYDVFGPYWERRNLDLSYILFSWQWDLFRAATYFYRPLVWDAGYWHFSVYARYPHRDYFYFGRPHFYVSYRGGHSWRMNGGRSYYEHHRDHYRPGNPRRDEHFGMRSGWDRGDYRDNNGGHRSSTHVTGGRGDNPGNGGGAARNGGRDNGQPRGGFGSGRGGNANPGTRGDVGDRPVRQNGNSNGSFGGNRSNAGQGSTPRQPERNIRQNDNTLRQSGNSSRQPERSIRQSDNTPRQSSNSVRQSESSRVSSGRVSGGNAGGSRVSGGNAGGSRVSSGSSGGGRVSSGGGGRSGGGNSNGHFGGGRR